MKQIIDTLIVDDEKAAREGIRILLEEDLEIRVRGVAKNGLEAIELVHKVHPDLIFLDIQMPGINGFEVLNSLEISPKPYVIFVTAFDEYALKAFEVHALDYLLKPFSDERFFGALEIAKRKIKSDQVQKLNSKIEELILDFSSRIKSDVDSHWVDHKRKPDDRFIIKHSGKIIFIEPEQLIWIEADGYYVKLHTTKKSYLIRKSMKQIGQLLPSQSFMRIHKSSIINISYIAEVEPYFNGEYFIRLRNGSEVKVSRSYKDDFNEFLEKKRL